MRQSGSMKPFGFHTIYDFHSSHVSCLQLPRRDRLIMIQSVAIWPIYTASCAQANRIEVTVRFFAGLLFSLGGRERCRSNVCHIPRHENQLCSSSYLCLIPTIWDRPSHRMAFSLSLEAQRHILNLTEVSMTEFPIECIVLLANIFLSGFTSLH